MRQQLAYRLRGELLLTFTIISLCDLKDTVLSSQVEAINSSFLVPIFWYHFLYSTCGKKL